MIEGSFDGRTTARVPGVAALAAATRRPRGAFDTHGTACSAGFDAICDDLAKRIGASRIAVEGAGHEVQFTGAPLNDALLSLWRTAESRLASA